MCSFDQGPTAACVWDIQGWVWLSARRLSLFRYKKEMITLISMQRILSLMAQAAKTAFIFLEGKKKSIFFLYSTYGLLCLLRGLTL